MTLIVMVEAASRKMLWADFIEALGSARTRVLYYLADYGLKVAWFFALFDFSAVRMNYRSGWVSSDSSKLN